MSYACTRRIEQLLPCSLLVVTSHHIVLCSERRLQLINFEGTQEREWLLDSVIRYIKVGCGTGGRRGRGGGRYA